MSLPPNPSGSAGNSQPSEEARMRRALGLRDDPRPNDPSAATRAAEQRPAERTMQRREPDRRARRFVKDGEVPVVVLSGSREHGADAPVPVNRLAVAESALETERAARERAERSLQEALASVQQLRTQIAHASLAHGEAFATERRAREAAEQARNDAEAARDAAEQARMEANAARDALVTELDALRAASVSEPAQTRSIRRRRESKPELEQREQQPVKWWLPSYKAGTRKS